MNKTREKFITNRIAFAVKEKTHSIYNRLFILFLGDGYMLDLFVLIDFLLVIELNVLLSGFLKGDEVAHAYSSANVTR